MMICYYVAQHIKEHLASAFQQIAIFREYKPTKEKDNKDCAEDIARLLSRVHRHFCAARDRLKASGHSVRTLSLVV